MLKHVFGMFAGLLLAGGAQAATIERTGPIQTDPGVGCSLTMSGQIEQGDAQKLQTVLTRVAEEADHPSNQLERQIVLCLESPGGSFTEALRIAEALHDLSISTRINPASECLSACALAFMGGNFDTGSGEGWRASRYLHPTSQLGFHAPALVLPEGDFTREDVERAYGIAIQAVGLISRKADKLRIPQALLTEMFNNVGETFHYADRVDHAATYNIQLYGYSVPPVSAETRRFACLNGWNWAGRETGGALDSFVRYASGLTENSAGYVEFTPFDGWVYCGLKDTALGGGPMDRVIHSELQDLRNPTFDRYHPQWIRYPGPMPLDQITPGTTRDF